MKQIKKIFIIFAMLSIFGLVGGGCLLPAESSNSQQQSQQASSIAKESSSQKEESSQQQFPPIDSSFNFGNMDDEDEPFDTPLSPL